MLTIGSVCSGIGGLELGLEAAGLGPTKWQIEIDPYARAVLAKHWPDAVRHEDLRHVQPEQLSPVDIICGGTPCQDLSQAGQRAGIEGSKARSGSNSSGSSPRSAPTSSSGKTLLDRFGGVWAVLSPTSASSITKWSGPGSLRPTRAARTSVNGSSLWPTPTVKGNHNKAGLSAKSGDGLSTAINRGLSNPGPLNPPFLEWLMGFPIGHSETELSVTPARRRKPRSSAG